MGVLKDFVEAVGGGMRSKQRVCGRCVAVAGSRLGASLVHFKGVIKTKKRKEYRDQSIEVTYQTQSSMERVSIFVNK